MLKVLKNMLLVVILLPFITYSAQSKLQESTDSFQHYRCEIIVKYMYLREITNEFGNILLAGNYSNIFLASEDLIESLDEMKHELEAMAVPGEVKEPYAVFLKSIESYRQSAEHIHIAMGIVLGRNQGKRIDIQKLIDMSEYHVVMANKYLVLSVILHGKIFDANKQASYECSKQVAVIY